MRRKQTCNMLGLNCAADVMTRSRGLVLDRAHGHGLLPADTACSAADGCLVITTKMVESSNKEADHLR